MIANKSMEDIAFDRVEEMKSHKSIEGIAE